MTEDDGTSGSGGFTINWDEVDEETREELESMEVPEQTETDVDIADKINEQNVKGRIDRLEASYDDVPVTEETFELSPEEYSEVYSATKGTGYDGNSVVFVTRDGDSLPGLSENIPEQAAHDTRDRVLMVLGRGADLWALPGDGNGGQYESLQEAAVRRVHEQTGVRCTITGVEEVFHRKYYPDSDADGSVHTLDVYFQAEYRKGSLDVDESELTGAAWFAEPPKQLTEGAEQIWQRFVDGGE